MNIKFTPIATPTETKTVTREPVVKTLGERANLWGTQQNITKAPSNTFNWFRRWTIKKDDSVFDK